MAKINLLPWRAERRKQREREFYTMLGMAAVAAVLAVILWSWWMSGRIDVQEQRITLMKDEIKQLDSKLTEIKKLEETKSKLLARKQIIEQLQASRAQMVHLFDELVKTIPDGVRLNALKQSGDTLTLEGVAQSNASVATYMRNLENSPWLVHSDLQKTEAKGNDKRNRYEFALNVKLRKPADADNAQDGTQGAPAKGAAQPSPVKNPSGPPPPPQAVATPGDAP
ncbi:MAG TPA: PilN domain-containing protein [Rudaea sp.]|nr:PilN domain-containing protein [Rudaea sp.]